MLHSSTPERLAAASIDLTEASAQRLVALLERTQQRAPFQRIRNSQLVSALIGTVGLALFIVGVENAAGDIPVLSNAYGSIGVGLSLLVITGLALRTLAGHGALAQRAADDPPIGAL